MSRLRRLVVSDRWFFITCRLLASRPQDWSWSSVHDYTGSVQRPVVTPSGLCIDRVLLPADAHTRI